MPTLFELATPRSLVTYRTPQGCIARARVHIQNFRDGVLVCTIGGRYGSPVCVRADQLITVSPRANVPRTPLNTIE